jgi:hypothetical protein
MSTHQVLHRFQGQSASVDHLDSPAGAAPVSSSAPRRGLDMYASAMRAIEPFLSEEALLELVRQLCIEECRRHFARVELRTHQEIDPQAVSQIHPPERCWFAYMVVSQQEASWTEAEIQVTVSLSESALHLMFR